MSNELNMRRNDFLFFIIYLAFAILRPTFSKAQDSSLTPNRIRFEQHLGAQIPMNSSFIDEYGQKHPLSYFVGKRPVIVVFTYFKCPNLCNLILNGLLQVLHQIPDHLEKDYSVITISIDPSERSPLALTKKRTYLAKMGIVEQGQLRKSGWHFLTVPQDENQNITSLTEISGFHFYKDSESGEYAHPSGIIILTPEGNISQYFFGIQFNSNSLHQALARANSGTRGSWVEEVLLYCFHYDPKLSKNGPTILRAIRYTGVAGVVFVLGLLFYLFSIECRSQCKARNEA